jgi:hypothetical protein
MLPILSTMLPIVGLTLPLARRLSLLQRLDISVNRLTTLGAGMKSLGQLRELRAASNLVRWDSTISALTLAAD